MKRYLLKAKVEPLEDGRFLAHCSDIQGCHAEGDSVADALLNLEDVARVLLELRKEDGLPIPRDLKGYGAKKNLKAELVIAQPE